MKTAPTFAAYDRHLLELDEAARIWNRTAATEADPKLKALASLMNQRARDYATTLRELLGEYRRRGVSTRPVMIAARDKA